ncbi:MAG: DUF6152 family protein [Sphingomonadaceae bacterium]
MRHAIMAAILALLPMLAANAHHGWSSYDAAQVLTVKAPLKGLRWENPHGTAKVSYNKAEWDVVLAPVSRMEARGLTRDMVEKGQVVTLIGYPRTDGTKEMRIERVIVDGKTVELR